MTTGRQAHRTIQVYSVSLQEQQMAQTHTASRRTHTVSRQTHIISLYPGRKVGMHMHMDSHQTRQAAQTDMSIIRAVHMVMQIRVYTIRTQMPRAYGQTQYGQQPNGQGGYNQTAYGQTAYNQPQYGANPYNQPPKDSNGFGIASLVLGIASIVLFCTCINYVTALLAIIFGIIHIIKGNNKVFGIVGIATAAISVIVSIIFWVVAGSSVSTDLEKEFMKGFDEGYEYYNDDDSYEDYDYDSYDYDDFDYQNFEYDGIY